MVLVLDHLELKAWFSWCWTQCCYSRGRMLQRGNWRISENVSVQALHERKQLNAKKIEQLKAKRSFVCFLVYFFVAWSNVMSYDVRCHACVQARLRELRGEDRVAEGQSGIVVWEHFWAPDTADTAAITTWSDTCHSHSNYSNYSNHSSIGQLWQLWWDCRSHLKRKVKSRQMAVLTWSSYVHIGADSLKDIFCIDLCLQCAIVSCIMKYIQCAIVWMKRSLASI